MFEVQLNAGLDARPLARVASGGELSRLMLALKVVLATHDAVPALVFDEVDQGIGGEAGVKVGEALATVARGERPAGAGDHPSAADRRLRGPPPRGIEGGTRRHRDVGRAGGDGGSAAARAGAHAGGSRHGHGVAARRRAAQNIFQSIRITIRNTVVSAHRHALAVDGLFDRKPSFHLRPALGDGKAHPRACSARCPRPEHAGGYRRSEVGSRGPPSPAADRKL